ncbi:phenylalanine/histidine ammonia-lyase [Labedella phragmitis]|uniref:Phenylalanine/histidine ammonia-lyase n=1 Tax=Labedella phragmitis TaxID=2498849 RepID=A0A3S3ZSX9_9MICO|nr:aromatic amino acid ammonia-lyase [Labedella phragmitis]RWZ52954.1 phenylalanine/histidine ammonia-lyase [Labedella phragmitis]
MGDVVVRAADDLDRRALLAVADGARLTIGDELREALRSRRAEVLAALESGGPVYGVTTGMGAASEIRLTAAEQAQHQENLMLARAVGHGEWLGARETRAVLVARIGTFLLGDVGVSAELVDRLVEMLDRDILPAIPRSGIGAAGEIIPLAHLGGAVTGSGEVLDPGSAGGSFSAATALAAVGLAPFALGPKEGVAMLEGVPVTTALAALRSADARMVAEQTTVVVAGALGVIGASLDTFSPEVARGDDVLARVLAAIRSRVRDGAAPRALQAPLSFRVVGSALAHLVRATDALDAAIERSLTGVTDSPAYLGGRFVGTAGFDGFELAADLDALRVALVHLAELSVARLHRLLDDRVTGLARQLSAHPGAHAGMVVVHKHAVGVVHELHRRAAPVSIGARETSLGQEDVQSHSVAAAVEAAHAIVLVRDVIASELLAVVHAVRLSGADTDPDGPLAAADAVVADGVVDRPFGRDIAALTRLLASGWGSDSGEAG